MAYVHADASAPDGIRLDRSTNGCAYDGSGRPDGAILSLLAGSTPDQPWPRTTGESAEIVQRLLECWQVLPSLTIEQMDGAVARMLSPPDHQRLRRAWLAVGAFTKAQVVACRRLVEAFHGSGLEYCLLKGSATALLLYPRPHDRGAWDIDVGVRPADLGRAEAMVRKLGYRPAQLDGAKGFRIADAAIRARVEATHYELGFLVRRLQVTNLPAETLEALRAEPWARRFWFDVESEAPFCFTSVDVHHALSHDIPLDDLMAHAREATLDGQPARVPDDAWVAAHLIFKIYWEGVHSYRKGLYEYADLVRLAPRLDPSVFERLVALLERHHLTAAGHYVLRRLPLFGVAPAHHVRRFVDETSQAPLSVDPRVANDLGDMWPKLWGRR
jgi:hypothetical protein